MPELSTLLHPLYETVLDSESWTELLPRLNETFNCHFSDVFSRTADWSRFQGLAAGLDTADYQDTFLGYWTKRNVWAERHPVERAGEVVATTDFLTRAELERSEMYADYLDRRGLHQGLRLATWCGEGWVNDISLIRSWSAGEFTAQERRMAEWLIPHLRRAAAMALAIRPAPFLAGGTSLDAIGSPALLVTADGAVLRHNAAAEQLAREGDLLAIVGTHLRQGTHTGQLALLPAALARAGQRDAPVGTTLRFIDRHAQAHRLLLIPVTARRVWPIPEESAILVLAIRADEPGLLSASELTKRFGLTPTEAGLARQFAGGATVASISEETGRSTNTVRTHLHRILQKTQCRRQADLVRLVLGGPAEERRPFGRAPIFAAGEPD